MRRFAFWLCTSIAFLIISCKTVKEGAGAVTKASKKEMTKSWDELQSLVFPYQTVSYKSKIDIDAPELKIQVKLNTHLIKDSILWASVSKFGIESHRMLLTPDSIKILDRLSNQYIVGSISKWIEDQGLNLTFDELQRLWIGMHPKNPVSNVEPMSLSPNYQIFWQEQGLDIRYVFALPQNQLHNIHIKDQMDQNLQINQSRFNNHGASSIPYNRSYEIDGKETLRLDHEIQEVKINASKNLSFHIPEKYNQVAL